jgi:addiction module HigA family antidote
MTKRVYKRKVTNKRVTKRVGVVRATLVTPGELLLKEFIEPMCLSQSRLAKEIGVSAQRIGEIINGKRKITEDTDLRLSKFFGLSAGYWLRAQNAHDLEVAKIN